MPYQNMIKLLFGIWKLVCITFFIGGLTLCGFWLISGSYIYHFEARNNYDDKLPINQVFIIGNGKAIYRQWVENAYTGEIVYKFPLKEIGGILHNTTNHSVVDLPSNLTSGKYIIKAIIYYAPNPLKESDIEIKVGEFIVP